MVLMITFPTQRCVWIMTLNCVIRPIMLVLLAKRILLDISSSSNIRQWRCRAVVVACLLLLPSDYYNNSVGEEEEGHC